MGIIFAIAFYGGLVLLIGSLRILELCCNAFAPPRRGAARFVLLTLLALEGTALLVLVFLVVHQIGIAEFLIG